MVHRHIWIFLALNICKVFHRNAEGAFVSTGLTTSNLCNVDFSAAILNYVVHSFSMIVEGNM